MTLEGNWVRGRPSKGLRQLNIRYKVEDAEFGPIEDLLEKLPYSKVNVVMVQALLLGAKIMLSTSSSSIDQLVNVPTKRQSRSSSVSLSGSLGAGGAPPSDPEAPGFGKAATGMFEQFGKDQ